MPQDDDSAKSYLKGFQEGLQEAWEEIIKLTTKGYTSRELQIMAKTKKSMLYQRVQQKTDELERVLGRKISVQEPQSAPAVAPSPQAPVKLQAGWSYVIKENRPERSFGLFSGLISGGSPGLCISRTHPDSLKQKYGFDAEALWLTKTENSHSTADSKDTQFVSPNNLAHITSSIKDFLSKGPGRAVIMEGIEYLTTQNDFKSVLKFIELINDQIVLDKGYLLIPVDVASMDPKDLSLIEREMSQVL